MSGKMYNLSIMRQIHGIDIDEGVRTKGSRRAYFETLSMFGARIRPQVDALFDATNKKELTITLNNVHAILLEICDNDISEKVENAIVLCKREYGSDAIKSTLHNIRRGIATLIQKIDDAEIKPEIEETQKEEEDMVAAEKEAADDAAPPVYTQTRLDNKGIAGPRQRIEPRSAFFLNLISSVDTMNYDAAVEEIATLQNFSYGLDIDICLENVRKRFTEFDYAAAEEEIRRLRGMLASGDGSETKDKKKILAIDDMPDVLNTLKSLLKDQYNVYCATNHAAALKFLVNNTPDLILIDIEMPDMDGFTLLKIIRQLNNCKTVPAIYLTGNASVESVKASIDAGGNDFIKKPVDAEIVFSKIRKNLDKHISKK